MVQASLVQDQRRDTVQEETERIKEERPIHIQVIDGNTQQRKTQGSPGTMEGTSVGNRTNGEIFSITILHKQELQNTRSVHQAEDKRIQV